MEGSTYATLEEEEAKLEVVVMEADHKEAARNAARQAHDDALRAHKQALMDLHNAEREARLRYSRALDHAQTAFKAEAEEDEALALINQKETQRAASAAYTRELKALQMRANETAEALWEASAPEREYAAAQAEALAQATLIKAVRFAVLRRDRTRARSVLLVA